MSASPGEVASSTVIIPLLFSTICLKAESSDTFHIGDSLKTHKTFYRQKEVNED